MINPAPFILKDRNARVGFAYTVTFPVDSMQGFGFTAEHQGQIASVTAMNVASYSLRKNGSAVGVPFNVERGDSIMIDDLVKIDDARTSTFLFRAPKFDQQNVAVTALTQIDQTRKHLFVINYTDQTVSVIDTETDTVESTINLPTTGVGQGYEFQSIAYRSADDHMYVFGLSRVCKINANPASPNFKGVYDVSGAQDSTTIINTGVPIPFTNAIYDYVNDCMYLGITGTVRVMFKWDFIVIKTSFPNLINSSGFFVPNNRLFFCGNINAKIEDGSRTGWNPVGGNEPPSTKGCFIAKNNSVILGKAAITECNVDTFEILKTYGSTGAQNSFNEIFSSFQYSPFYDIVIGITYVNLTMNVTVIDISTSTILGSFVRENKQSGDDIARSLCYGAYSKKFYFLANGSSPQNRVHKLNPQLWIANGKTDLSDMTDGFISVGDVSNLSGTTTSDARRYANNAMAFNHLIPS